MTHSGLKGDHEGDSEIISHQLSTNTSLPTTMATMKHGENSEIYRLILHDFLNFEVTGFKPFGGGIGSTAHWESRTYYQKACKTKTVDFK